MEKDLLIIGRILAPWGLKGDVKVEILTDYPQERFTPGKLVYVDGSAMTIEGGRPHKGNIILKLDDVADADQASDLRGKYLEIPASESMPLEDDQFYHHQLIGLSVETTEGRLLGVIKRILPTGSNDVYVVDGDGRDLLVPAIGDVVKQVDLSRGLVVIEEIDGLL
jgi:16S rRNA processing protein RimM